MRLAERIKKRPLPIGIFVGGLFFILFLSWCFLLPEPLFKEPYATVLLDRKGEILGLRAAADEQLRFEEIDRLPMRYVAAAMAFEDRCFMLHHGVNWWALVRALKQNIQAGRIVSGGSTLSMQVIRLAQGNPPRTVSRKIGEIILTLRLEQNYSKYQLLKWYASHAPFGGNIVGIRAAAFKYFNRPPEQMSWAEAALLAVLPNAPALIYPGKNNPLLKRKRDRLLSKLFAEKMMSEDDYRLATSEPLPEMMSEIPAVAPHLLDRTCLEKNGKVTRSAIDGQLQRQVNEIVERHTAMLSQNYIYNVAVLVAHVPTGEVRAYVGNSAPRSGSRGNDVDIIRSVRSSGSILKPALYAQMLQGGFILPRTLIPDVPSRFGSYAPANFSRDFKGAVPADLALAQSLNIPFVRMLRDYTYTRFYDDLKEMGITSLNRKADNYGLSLILGGAETSLWDICNLYGGMASVLRHYNDDDGQYRAGEYHRLHLWEAGEEDGKQALKRGQQSPVYTNAATQARTGGGELKAAAIWQTLKALENVERPEMEMGWKNFASSMNLAWKTGTSFGFRDAWAVGVNPEYVIGVWVGNADGEGRPGLIGVRTAAPILFEVAGLLPVNTSFYEPAEEMQEVVVCRKSGYRASSLCDETDTVRVCVAAMKTDVCPFHRLINLDEGGTWRVTSDCEPVHRIKVKSWFVLPPVQEWYYCRTHTDYRKLPPYRSDCHPLEEEVMEMIYPQRGTRVFIPRDFGGKPGRAIFEAVHRSPTAEIYWHVDHQYLGTTRSMHQMEIYLKEGRHLLTLMDGEGNTLQQSFSVVGKDTPEKNGK
ncbi:MAG: transglycosylase domain-containing protein [Odoribacter sp.]